MRKPIIYLLVLPILALCVACSSQPDEPYRSAYHHTPISKWMNDPNGMFYQDGVWHLYYQHNPFGTTWGPMHWAHATSTDLLTWEEHPIVLYPDSLGTIFSGSAVIDTDNTAGFGANAIIAIYTQSEICGQNQSIAYSLDGGYSFTPYEGNPVIMGDVPDFRDPKVTRDGDHWLMTLACGQEIRFFSSTNLREWTYLSSFGEGYGNHNGVWECPELIKMGNQWVLLVSINPGGPFGGSATQYFVGDWNGTDFKCIDNPEEQKWLDYGKDNYSTFTFHNAPDNRFVALGWMSNWQYANQLPTIAFRSQNTVARDLSLYQDDAGEYRIASVPSKETQAIRGRETKHLPATAVVDLELDGNRDVLITLSNKRGEKVIMTLDAHRQTFSMDRTSSGDCSFSHDFSACTTTPLFIAHETHYITLFIDRCSIEVFGTNGEWTMTNLVFPSEPYDKIEVQGGKMTIYSCKIN